MRNDVLPERKEPEPIGSLDAFSLIDDPRDDQKKRATKGRNRLSASCLPWSAHP